MKITLDTNCLIDLETKGERQLCMEKIISKFKKSDLAVVAVSASDKNFNGMTIENFSEFKKWLLDLDLKDLRILKSLAYESIAYFDWAIIPTDEMIELDHKIHDILFLGLPYEAPPKYLFRKWRNAKADVLIMWAHIWNKRDFFITRDKNFLKQSKKEKLEQIGAGKILTPDDFFKKNSKK